MGEDDRPTGQGWDGPSELLVVLAAGPEPDAGPGGAGGPGCADDRGGLGVPGRRDVLAPLAGQGLVTSRLPPRLALVALPPDRADEVVRLAGVEGVFTDDIPSALRAALDPVEQVFVDGWLLRSRPKPLRPGEGRPWDSQPGPGEPPRTAPR